MKKWFCTKCGMRVNQKFKPSIDHEGECSMLIDELRVKMSGGGKIPRNHRVHRWVDMDEEEVETYQDVKREYNELNNDEKQINSFFKEKHGQDLFLSDGTLNENLNKPPKTLKEEMGDIKNEFSKVKEDFINGIKSLKNIFRK